MANTTSNGSLDEGSGGWELEEKGEGRERLSEVAQKKGISQDRISSLFKPQIIYDKNREKTDFFVVD